MVCGDDISLLVSLSCWEWPLERCFNSEGRMGYMTTLHHPRRRVSGQLKPEGSCWQEWFLVWPWRHRQILWFQSVRETMAYPSQSIPGPTQSHADKQTIDLRRNIRKTMQRMWKRMNAGMNIVWHEYTLNSGSGDEIQPILNLQEAVMQSWEDCQINFDIWGKG